MRAWGIAALLVLGLAGNAARADDKPTDNKPSGGSKYIGDRGGHLTTLLFGSPAPAISKTAKADSDKYQAAPRLTQAIAHDPQRNINAVLRRVQVCDRLRQIAEQSGNAELQHQADELEARAWAIYQQQTEAMPSPSSAPIVEKNAAAAGKPSDSLPQLGGDVDRTADILRGRERP
jgi:hypothetical protein